MIQKWYNRILWTSLLTLVLGMLIVLPILMSFELGREILNVIAIFIPVAGIVAMSLIFGDIFWDCRHFSGWVNQCDKPLD